MSLRVLGIFFGILTMVSGRLLAGDEQKSTHGVGIFNPERVFIAATIRSKQALFSESARVIGGHILVINAEQKTAMVEALSGTEQAVLNKRNLLFRSLYVAEMCNANIEVFVSQVDHFIWLRPTNDVLTSNVAKVRSRRDGFLSEPTVPLKDLFAEQHIDKMAWDQYQRKEEKSNLTLKSIAKDLVRFAPNKKSFSDLIHAFIESHYPPNGQESSDELVASYQKYEDNLISNWETNFNASERYSNWIASETQAASVDKIAWVPEPACDPSLFLQY